MRGDDQQQSGMFSYISAEQRVPQNHPLRPMRKMVDAALAEMSPRFARLYAKRGRAQLLELSCNWGDEPLTDLRETESLAATVARALGITTQELKVRLGESRMIIGDTDIAGRRARETASDNGNYLAG